MNKLFLLIICVALLITPALAADYMGKFTVEKVESINGVHAWASSQTFTLNKSQSKDYLGMATVTYLDVDTTSSPFHVSITSTGTGTSSFVIAPGETKNIKGNYYDNATLANIDDIRIKMTELNQISTGTINSTSDNPVYAYFYTDREWALKKDDTVTFDAKAQKTTSDSGVTYSGTTSLKEIYAYFKRLQNVPVSITVSSENEPSRSWDNEKVKFTIDKSGTYIFTIKYDVINPWGAATETVEKYTLAVKGLETTSTTSQILTTAQYDVFTGDTKTFPMTSPGSFSAISGATITPVSNSTYSVLFTAPGTYTLIYTTTNGAQTPINVNVIQKPSTLVTPIVTVKANQAQGTGAGTNGTLGIDNIYIGLGLAGILLGIIYIRKNKGKGTGHYEARKNLG